MRLLIRRISRKKTENKFPYIINIHVDNYIEIVIDMGVNLLIYKDYISYSHGVENVLQTCLKVFAKLLKTFRGC